MTQAWKPDDNLQQARRIGKTIEELGELIAVLGRISIQGMDAIDPASGKMNRQRMHEETADVMAQFACNLEAFNMDDSMMIARSADKIAQMVEWESMSPEHGIDA